MNPGPFAFRTEGTFLVFPWGNPRIVLGPSGPLGGGEFQRLDHGAHVEFRLKVNVPI